MKIEKKFNVTEVIKNNDFNTYKSQKNALKSRVFERDHISVAKLGKLNIKKTIHRQIYCNKYVCFFYTPNKSKTKPQEVNKMNETTMPQNSLEPLVKATMKAIQSICSDLKLDRTIPCTIYAVYEPDEGQNLYRYDVVINSSTYTMYSAVGDVFKEHDRVWVTYPCGDMQNGYISGRRFVKYGNTCYK